MAKSYDTIIIGASGNRFGNAPIAGESLAGIIEATQFGKDHDSSPVVFQRKNIDFTFSSGFHSRLREVKQGGSFSVLG
jgi:hypothetical protein